MNITIKEEIVRDIIHELTTNTNELGIVTAESLQLARILEYKLKDKSNSQLNNGLNKTVKAILKRSAKKGKPSIEKVWELNGKYYATDSFIAIEMNENYLGLPLYDEPNKVNLEHVFKTFETIDEEFEIDITELDKCICESKKLGKKPVYVLGEGLAIDPNLLKEAILATGNTTVCRKGLTCLIKSPNVRALFTTMRLFSPPKDYTTVTVKTFKPHTFDMIEK